MGFGVFGTEVERAFGIELGTGTGTGTGSGRECRGRFGVLRGGKHGLTSLMKVMIKGAVVAAFAIGHKLFEALRKKQ